MKSILRSASGVLALSLVACGVNPSDFNSTEVSGSEIESEITESEGFGLAMDRDACALKVNKATFTLAEGGSLDVSYSFFRLTKGDRVQVRNADTGEVVYDSSELSAAAGVLKIPVSTLGAGRYITEGYMNTLAANQDPEADCAIPSKIVIRKR